MTESFVDDSERIPAKQIGKGVMWSYLTFVIGKVMVFISTVILARLLMPEDFGLVGLASVIAGYLGTLHTFGVGEAFIQKRFGSEESANATFVLSAVSGVLLFLLSLIITPAAVIFFREPRIQIIFPVLASTYILTGLTTIHDALLVKELKFQQRLLPTFVQSISKGIGSILLALMGYGAWAIVWGVMIGTVAKSVTLVFVSPWRPTRAWDSKVTREIFGFGKYMVLQNIMGALEENIDYLIVGRQLGTTKLGLYSLGYRAPEMAIMSLPSVISNVVYPAYAKIHDNRELLRRSVLRTIQLVSWVAIPAGVGLAMVSSTFILTFYTSKWETVIPVMQILSLYAMVYTITYNFGDAYKAMGRVDILSKLSLSTIGFTIFSLWFGARYGLVGVAWAHLLRVILLGLVHIVIVNRVLNASFLHILDAIFRPLACAGIMALAMNGVSLLSHQLNNAIVLFSQLLTGSVTYFVFSWLINRSVTQYVWIMARQLLLGRGTQDVSAK
jgi:PST family polysaccharide transporter